MSLHITGDEPAIKVVAASGGYANRHGDGFSLDKISDAVGFGSSNAACKNESEYSQCKCVKPVHL